VTSDQPGMFLCISLQFYFTIKEIPDRESVRDPSLTATDCPPMHLATLDGGNMELKSHKPEFIEKIGRSFLFRAVVYVLPALYAGRLILMILTPQTFHMPDWKTIF
jgi:hypothetical protein